jgi:hypothetical protein
MNSLMMISCWSKHVGVLLSVFSVWHFKLIFYYIEVHLLAHYIQFIPIHCDFLVCRLGAVPVHYSCCVLYSSTSTLFTLGAVQLYQYAIHLVCCTAVPVRSSPCVLHSCTSTLFTCVLYSSTSTLFTLCAVQQYQYAINLVCWTAVPTAHSLHLHCLFQCTFTRHTAGFSFPSPTDARVHLVSIPNGLNGYKNRLSQHPYFMWPLSWGSKMLLHQLNFQTSTALQKWAPCAMDAWITKHSSTVLVPSILRAVGPWKQLHVSQVSSGTHNVAGNSASPTLLILCTSLPAQWSYVHFCH